MNERVEYSEHFEVDFSDFYVAHSFFIFRALSIILLESLLIRREFHNVAIKKETIDLIKYFCEESYEKLFENIKCHYSFMEKFIKKLFSH